MNDYKESILTFEAINGNYDKWNKVLYIGWHPNTFNAWGGDWFIKHINSKRENPCKVYIIERYIKYFDQLKNHKLTEEHNIKCILGDIIDYKEFDKYDLIIWWHGPEHVTESQLYNCLDNFEKYNVDIILGGPLGYDNYHEHASGDKHLCELSIEMFTNRGYKYKIFDRKERRQGPHISTWRLI